MEKKSYFVTNNESIEPKEDIEKPLLTDVETPAPVKDRISDISDKLKNLQNFFIQEISDVRAEIKNVTRSKIPDLTKNRLSNNSDLREKQINFLKEECQNKNLIINISWNNFFIQPLRILDIPISLQKLYLMSVVNTLKNPAKTSTLKDQRKNSIETTNRFFVLSLHENPTDSMAKDSSLDSACERSAQVDKHHTSSYKKN